MSSNVTWFAMYGNYTPRGERTPRILVVRLGAMGDIIHTLPAVADLRSEFPSARISWAVEPRWEPLLGGNPDIDEAIPFPLARWRRDGFGPSAWGQAWAFISQLRSKSFDLAIDFQGLVKSATVAGLSGARCVTGFDAGLLRESLAGLVYDLRSGTSHRHVIDRNRDLAAAVSGIGPRGPAVFRLPQGAVRNGLPDRFVLASPQAGWGSKQWPAENFSNLAGRLWHQFGMPLVADCAPGQERHAERIRSAAPPGAVLVHASTIPELIGVTRAASAVVGVDSGPLHLAAALGKHGVAIYGPTDPDRNGPYGSSIRVIRDDRAVTSYRRGTDPSDSMRACPPARVFDCLGPLIGFK